MSVSGGRSLVALAHHYRAHIAQDWVAVLIRARRAHMDCAGLAVGILLEPDHFRSSGERVAGKYRPQETAIGITQIGDRIERDGGHGLAEDDVEDEQISERGA